MRRFNATIDLGDPKPFVTGFWARSEADAKELADKWASECGGRVLSVQRPRRATAA